MNTAFLDEDIFAAARTIDALHTGVGKWLRLLTIILGSLSLAVLALQFYMGWPTSLAGVALILSSVVLVLIMVERYAHGVVNANLTYTPDAAQVLSDDLDFPDFLARLTSHPRVQYLLAKLLIDPAGLNRDVVRTRNQIIVAAKQLVQDRPIDLGDLLLLVLTESPAVFATIERQHLSKDDILKLLRWEGERELSIAFQRDSLDPDNLTLTGGLAKDWAAGYTVLLDRYSVDLTSLFANKKTRLHIVGHQRVIEEIARHLAKSNKSNVLLIGDPGVGKKTAVLAFAQRVYLGQTLPELSWKHVKMVDLAHLVAGADPEDIEVRLLTVLNEAARSGNVILFLDDIEMILGGQRTDDRERRGERISGLVDASAVLAKFLESSQIQIIATTTYDAYHQTIEGNPVLAAQFEKVEVGEPTVAETELITLDGTVKMEGEHRVLVTLAAVKEMVKLADRYLHEAPFPEKALDLAEEVAVYVARQTKEPIILPAHVQEVVTRKTDIPVAEAVGEERDVLINLEARLHERVVNQKEAIKVVADALRRARAGLKERNKPIGTFLFLGPTGVGKTETAKTVAEAYFGSENHMIRIDMNEFIQPEAAENLKEKLTTKAKEDPFTLVLFDEIEKAHPKVMNLLLRLLDEGKMDDLSGKTVDLTNTIIIGTSNAGAEIIRQSLLATSNSPIATSNSNNESRVASYQALKERLLDHLQKQGVFAPEFLNRFDAVVLFAPLTPVQIGQVVELMLNRLNLQLKEQGIEVKLEPAAVEKLAQVGYDPVFGARALRRTVQEKVENVVAKKILTGQVQTGQQVTLTTADIS
jgi:ATP-dependent Clp protease ATP-binding subunit ClpC